MSLEKQISNNGHLGEEPNTNSVYIEISHYDNDRLLKTETIPMTHFLEGFEKEFKKVRYN